MKTIQSARNWERERNIGAVRKLKHRLERYLSTFLVLVFPCFFFVFFLLLSSSSSLLFKSRCSPSSLHCQFSLQTLSSSKPLFLIASFSYHLQLLSSPVFEFVVISCKLSHLKSQFFWLHSKSFCVYQGLDLRANFVRELRERVSRESAIFRLGCAVWEAV